LGEDDPLMGLLDRSLVEWIVDRMAEPEDARLEVGINAYIQHVQEALIVAHRLSLPKTVALLHDRFSDLTGWAEALNLGSARDLRADYWHALALVQTRRSFLSLWNRCCDEAGNELPDSYLFIGLLGLQHLPRRDDDADLSHELLTGLARWARRLDDNDTDRHRFLREWRALALRYPRAPATLRDAVAPVLEVYSGRPFAKWWANEVGIEENVSCTPPRELGKKDTDALLMKLSKLNEASLGQEVEAFAEKAEHVADTLGDPYDLTRAFNRIGNAVLERAPKLSLRLAHSAIERDKNDAFSWKLWSAALHRIGLIDVSETVLWEAIRRFPDNMFCRTDLAIPRLREMSKKLLASRGWKDSSRRHDSRRLSDSGGTAGPDRVGSGRVG